MIIKKPNGEKVRLIRTRGLSSISVSTEDVEKSHDELVDFFQEQIEKTVNKRSELLERFAEVYLGHIYEKTGKMPQIEDIELVEEREGTSTRWYFREKCIRG